MPTRAEIDWERPRQREVEEFTDRWDWKRVYRTWSGRMEEFNVPLDPLFTTVTVHDPKNPARSETEVSWWPANEIQRLRIACQRHFNNHPDTRGTPHPEYELPKGQIDTARYLWRHRTEPETIAAILIAASLFSRLHSSRLRLPAEWPRLHLLQPLDRWAREKWLGHEAADQMWHPMSTAVLPLMSDDFVYKIDSMHALVRYLAEEHAAALHSFRAMEVRFAEAPDPFVAKILDEESRTQRQRWAEYAASRKEAEELERQRLAELREKHPRWGEFDRLTKDELSRLVWSKPTTQIAKEFGISDVAIGKRCKAQFIRKPPPGFWRRVETGQTPNPMGRPVA